MTAFAGLDVSQDKTAICIVSDEGAVVWRGSCATTPERIAATLGEHAPTLERAGLETGPLAAWLVHALRRLAVPIVCLDARHAHAALSMRLNESDTNDAEGLAQIVRTGWYREVSVKSVG